MWFGSELECQKQEENETDIPKVKFATSVNVVELNTETDNICESKFKKYKVKIMA